MKPLRTHAPAKHRNGAKVAALAAAALLAVSAAGCALDQPFAGLGNILGSPAQAQTTGAQGGVLAAAQRKVAAGADAKTLRQELSRVIDGGCATDGFPDTDCLARAYAPAAVESRLEAARFLLDNGVGVNQKNDSEEEPLNEVLGWLIWSGLPNGGYSDMGEELSKMAALFVSKGAEINGRMRVYVAPMGALFDGTPLGAAAITGCAELVRLLLENGAKVNEPTDITVEDDPTESPATTPLKLTQNVSKNASSEAGRNKYKEIISMLKAAGGKLTPSKTKKSKGK